MLRAAYRVAKFAEASLGCLLSLYSFCQTKMKDPGELALSVLISRIMFDNAETDHLTSIGYIGAIECSTSGSILEASGDDLEVFGNILGYTSQIANMIGEPFGLDAVEEVHLVGTNTTAICIPQEESNLGILCSNRANTEQILSELIDQG